MKSIFEMLGIKPTPENKKDFDKKIHDLVGIEYKNCSETWKAIKVRRAEDESQFLKDLKKALTT